ncbi:MAG: zinc ABC transporter substrate-binding protein [Calditrichaeota bacterium]|nr:MAG: zinc ABC transporter substrate-binding protein [Calditrichota bacterium]
MFSGIIKRLMLWAVIATVLGGSFPLMGGGKKIKVVTTLPVFASVAEEIGREHVETFAIAAGYQDPHFVDPKPSFIIKLQKADMFVHAGLDLEIGWVPPLLEGARNPDILPGGKGYVDASQNVPLLEIPAGDPATLRAQGDIHVYGNPHYWLDPLRGKIIARNICEGLIRLHPELEAEFRANLADFQQRIDTRLKVWQRQMAPLKGVKIVAYHNSWPYLEERFGFDIIAFIEPKPGIPPSPKHLVKIISLMRKHRVPLIIIEPYYSQKSSQLVASKTGAKVVELATSTDAYPEVKTYFDLFDYNIRRLLEALESGGGATGASGK